MIDKNTIIKKAKEVHNDKYIYTNVTNIRNVQEKIHIICPQHGDFYQSYWNHVRLKKGCKECGFIRTAQAKSMSKKEFIEKAMSTHSDIDNYDFTDLDIQTKDDKGRITIKCKIHGEFKMRPSHFMNGHICPYCTGRTKRDEDVKEELSKIHPGLDFSITKYSEHNKDYRIKVICPIHGVRHLKYGNLKRGQGCDLCCHKKGGLKHRLSYDTFIKRAEETFGVGTYVYSHDIMENRDKDGKIVVTCPTHGDFHVALHNFLAKHSGCPICNQSHLEEEVRLFLNRNNINFIQEKTFEWLKNKNQMFLDFYLSDYNIAIECQGEQHFIPNDYFGGEENFSQIIFRDNLKYELCKQHNIKILYFTHCNFKYSHTVITSLEKLKEAIFE